MSAAEPDTYFVEEDGELLFECGCLLTCLQRSKQLGASTKVKRRSDGKLLAYKLKATLSSTELEEEPVSEAKRGSTPRLLP